MYQPTIVGITLNYSLFYINNFVFGCLIALFMYSYFNNNLPEYFSNFFRLNENIHEGLNGV